VAIGNRIVTGTLKIPIKNQEAQTTLEELKNGISSSNADYNQKEIQNFNSNEWINPTNDRTDTTADIISDNSSYEYVSKLNAIGYDNNSQMNNVQIQNIIKQFQEDNSLEVTGELTNETKAKIDELYNNKDNQKITIPVNTSIYYGPSKNYGSYILQKSTQATIIKEFDDGWKLIQTTGNVSGYIYTTAGV
jgi:hypothetical protein